MENFTNETIDISQLPKYEEVVFTPLHSNYWKVILFNNAIFALLLFIGITVSYFIVDQVAEYLKIIVFASAILLVLAVLFSRINFRKSGYAFREHDVLYRHGIIATKTMIIPFNRVQHIALNEGLVSRFFGLTAIGIYTAGGVSSDIGIPGIPKEQAENIKHLLMTKIQKHL